jgi:hypothetical protein
LGISVVAGIWQIGSRLALHRGDAASYSIAMPPSWWDYFGATRAAGTRWDIGAHEFKKKAP